MIEGLLAIVEDVDEVLQLASWMAIYRYSLPSSLGVAHLRTVRSSQWLSGRQVRFIGIESEHEHIENGCSTSNISVAWLSRLEVIELANIQVVSA